MKIFLFVYVWSAIVTTIYFFVKRKKEWGDVYLGELIIWLMICFLFSEWGFILFDKYITQDFEDEQCNKKSNALIDWIQIILTLPFIIFYILFLKEGFLDKFKSTSFYKFKIF